jgi:hypothetical protein
MHSYTVKQTSLRGSPDSAIRQRQHLVYDVTVKTAVRGESFPLLVADPSHETAAEKSNPQRPFAIL